MHPILDRALALGMLTAALSDSVEAKSVGTTGRTFSDVSIGKDGSVSFKASETGLVTGSLIPKTTTVECTTKGAGGCK
jgi:streptogramin lyase